MNALPFSATYALADCAARILDEWRTSKHPAPDDANVRQILRQNAVDGLRYLWQTGDAMQRTTVACRVVIWVRRLKSHELAAWHTRITAREKARLGP